MIDVHVRPATAEDQKELGVMAGKLVRLHYEFDRQRFMNLENVEEGYGRWLAKETKRERALVLVATRADAPELVGYLYGAIEDRSYEDLRDECGYVHDVWVEESARRHGVAQLLLERACAHFKAKGSPRVVLMAATQNQAGQKLFSRLGFRPTMVEMTRELCD